MIPAGNVNMGRESAARTIRCLAIMAVAGGCRSESAIVPFVVRDSAGVQIVESTEAEWLHAPPWNLSYEPLLAIGGVEAAPEYEFHQIQDAARLSDGAIVVADQGFEEALRVFDRDGTLRNSFGHRGPGPGEFQRIASIERANADTLVIADDGQLRIAFLTHDGTEVRSLAYGRSGSVPPGALQRHSDGRWVGILTGFAPREEPSSPGIYQIEAALVQMGATALETDTIGTFPGADIAYIDMGGEELVRGVVPFGRELRFAVADSGAYVGFGAQLSYELWSLEGRLIRSVRAIGPDLTLTDADFTRLRDAALDALPEGEDRAVLNRYLSQLPRPPQRAAYAQMLADAEGNVWLGPYRSSAGANGPWHVFGSSGRYLGEIQIPAQLQPYEIGRDYVLGRWRDELGVETIRLYELLKP